MSMFTEDLEKQVADLCEQVRDLGGTPCCPPEVVPQPEPAVPPPRQLLSELIFGSDARESIPGVLQPPLLPQEARDRINGRVRMLLAAHKVEYVDEIVALGCTGLSVRGMSVESIREVHAGLGGTGHVLPCYVGLDRFCLVHNTIGGLQEGQEQRHPGAVANVSRPLTKEERAKVAVVEHARRQKEQAAAVDTLAGRKLSPELEAELAGITGAETKPGGEARLDEAAPSARELAAAYHALLDRLQGDGARWICPEHVKTFWPCRFCVAQVIVEGSFDMEFVVGGAPDIIQAPRLEAALDVLQDKGFDRVTLYARVATFRRKLAREE